MEYNIKKEVEITLNLTEREFNTIFAAIGKTPYYKLEEKIKDERLEKEEFEILHPSEVQDLYNKIVKIFNGIKLK